MKLVFKRCKEAFTGSQSEDACPISPSDAQTPSTSWYLDDSESNHEQESGQKKSNVIEVNASSTTEIVQVSKSERQYFFFVFLKQEGKL